MVKSEQASKNIFYIEKTEFLRSMMELALKSKGAQIYTVATLENNFYLLDDLKPDLVIFDVKSVGHLLDELCQLLPRNKLLALGDESERLLVEGRVKQFWTKPLEAGQLATRLLALAE
jgi:DNA-binding response OmpR family regulator